MLWFNVAAGIVNLNSFKFQYILCYGSTVPNVSGLFLKENFNTSYVMVQLTGQFRVQSYHLISIHLMLWFNRCDRVCNAIYRYFNTSYVMVQRKNFYRKF